MVTNAANIAEGPNATKHTKRYMTPRSVIVTPYCRGPAASAGTSGLADSPRRQRTGLRGPRYHHQPWSGKTQAKGGKQAWRCSRAVPGAGIAPPPSAPPRPAPRWPFRHQRSLRDCTLGGGAAGGRRCLEPGLRDRGSRTPSPHPSPGTAVAGRAGEGRVRFPCPSPSLAIISTKMHQT